VRTSTAVMTFFALLGMLGGTRLAPAQDAPPPPAAGPSLPPAPHPLEGFWELRMERTVWWPYLVPGSLAVTRSKAGLRGSVTFDSMWAIDPEPLRFDEAKGDHVRLTIRLPGGVDVPIEGDVRDGVFTARVRWGDEGRTESSFLSGYRLPPQRRFEVDTMDGPFPRETDAALLGIDPAALDRLIHYAGRFDTDALVVVKDGRLVCDRTFLRPRGLCPTQSVTKVVASTALPLLMEEEKIPRDLDTPLTTWFPEWKDDPRKARITLRHVLTHTTGLAVAGTNAMQLGSDHLRRALASPAEHEPGTQFAYNDQGMELLSGIVHRASGERVDEYLAKRVFGPLGITRWRWSRDGAGNTPACLGLDLHALDLARFGWMVCRRGAWGEAQVVPERWFVDVAVPGRVNEEVGLVWHLRREPSAEQVVQTQEQIERLRALGWADADALKPLVGQVFAGRDAWWAAVRKAAGAESTKRLYKLLGHPEVGGELQGPVDCLQQWGSMGQYVLVFPQKGLVVVRQRRGFANAELPSEVAAGGAFDNIVELARALVP
jgi:CubicO group peptidase (beta-lactamase class C family)